MAKKFIEFLEAAALIILTGVIVLGVIKYIDSKEELKEEDPIVDVEQGGDETPNEDEGPLLITATLFYQGEHTDYETMQYEDGMTWGEWLVSEYYIEDFYFYDDLVVQSGYGPTPYKVNDLITGTEIELCGN